MAYVSASFAPSVDVAWAAGLFEGEGSFEITKAAKTSARLGLSSTDLDVLQRFAQITGVGSIRPHKPANYRTSVKPAWMWRTRNRTETLTAVQLLLPYLGQRRTEQAQRCLQVLLTHIPERPCEHCGIPFTPPNGMQGHQRFCSVRCQKASQYERAKARGAPWANGPAKWNRELARRSGTQLP